MHNCLINLKSFLAIVGILFSQFSFCQSSPAIDTSVSTKLAGFTKGNLSIELMASVLPKANISRDGGKYHLKSLLQSSYDLGINYIYNINRKWNITTGLHFVVGKRNFYMDLPVGDAGPSYPDMGGPRFIEDKELWGSFRIPLLVERKLITPKKRVMAIRAGINFRYSGLMLDESIGGSIIGPGGNPSPDIFTADFPAYKKPWFTFLAGVSRQFVLRNSNILAVGLNADISFTYFMKGNYAITIPTQPVTTGVYKINGSGLGLSVSYVFTGSNKKPYFASRKRKGSRQRINRGDVLSNYVFKGRQIQFEFAPLYTFKARVQKVSGDHPVSTTGTPGLLLSFKYRINFNKYYSLITGPEATLAGRNMVVSFSKNDFNPPLLYDYRMGVMDMYVSDLILSLPVILQKRLLYAKTKYLFAEAGLRLNFSLGADFDGFSIHLRRADSSFFNAGGWDVTANNDTKPWISFPINAGHAWLLKNNNVLQLTICSNISFTKYVDGIYLINKPGQPFTQGRYSSAGSYIGLSVGYIFTNANYRMRKAGI